MTAERVAKRLILLAVIAFVGGVSARPVAALYEDIYRYVGFRQTATGYLWECETRPGFGRVATESKDP